MKSFFWCWLCGKYRRYTVIQLGNISIIVANLYTYNSFIIYLVLFLSLYWLTLFSSFKSYIFRIWRLLDFIGRWVTFKKYSWESLVVVVVSLILICDCKMISCWEFLLKIIYHFFFFFSRLSGASFQANFYLRFNDFLAISYFLYLHIQLSIGYANIRNSSMDLETWVLHSSRQPLDKIYSCQPHSGLLIYNNTKC